MRSLGSSLSGDIIVAAVVVVVAVAVVVVTDSSDNLGTNLGKYITKLGRFT